MKIDEHIRKLVADTGASELQLELRFDSDFNVRDDGPHVVRFNIRPEISYEHRDTTQELIKADIAETIATTPAERRRRR